MRAGVPFPSLPGGKIWPEGGIGAGGEQRCVSERRFPGVDARSKRTGV
jgi:hypothetical protein